MNKLPVVSFTGLNADSLGTYLASLGLFSLAARKWPSVRASWQNGRFCFVGGPKVLNDVVDFVDMVGKKSEWTEYQKPWDQDKKKDVQAKTSMRTARWRATEADEKTLHLFGAHLALDKRVRMNPLLGTGGNAGKRDFSKGWAQAVSTIKKPPRNLSRETLRQDMEAFLIGKACVYLKPFQAGSWFGEANKIYNHGTKKPFREGTVTPWAMALACEGLPFFVGETSRQMGNRRQPQGAFPFVTAATAPKNANEAGGIEAEVWLPIWNRPMTRPELSLLFMRGRSELRGKGATTSPAFSVAILARGVDAGITEFRRFLLLHTTSSQTFESRLANVVPTPMETEDEATIRATRTVIALRDALPPDRKVGQRWRFIGLRGPLEKALIDLSTSKPGIGRIEKAWMLVDEMFEVLARVDQNTTLRSHNVQFRLLPGKWAASLFHENPPDREARLALAISSLVRTPACAQFVAYRIGVYDTGRLWKFSESVPARRVWNDAEIAVNLCEMGERRVVEASQTNANAPPPFGATVPAGLNDVHAWLSGEVDEDRLRLWLNRLCLFDWSWKENREAARQVQSDLSKRENLIVDGPLALYGLFRPLFSERLFSQVAGNSAGVHSKKGTSCTHLARIIALLRRGDVVTAADAVQAVYHSAGISLADFDISMAGPDTERLLAALVIPSRADEVISIFQRWQSPSRSSKLT